MKKRPYTSKRHLLNAYSTLATAAETVGKDMATYYFNYFIDLNRKYPEDAAFSAEYDRYFTSLNYYKSIRDFQKPQITTIRSSIISATAISSST